MSVATLVSEQVRWLADQWEDHCGYPSAVLSGIVPDQRHLDNGGYHCSVEDLRRFDNEKDYSNTRPDDRDQNVQYGAGIDMSMSPADMKRCHDRVRRVWADKTDPRRVYVNAINTWSGTGDAVRLDFYANTSKYASPDHKWHNHGELRRRWLRDWTAVRAVVSVLRGDTVAQWKASLGQGDDDMTPEQNSALIEVRDNLRKLLPQSWATTNRAAALLSGQPASYQIEGEKTRRVEANGLAAQMSALTAAVTALAGKDFTDEQAIVAGVLAGLSPEAIAAVIPPSIAKQVADELAKRLAA